MSEQGAVKQSELLANVPAAKRKDVRDRFLTEDDWYKEGVTIWIRPSGIQRLAIAEEEPRLAQKFVRLFVRRPAQNRRYVLCTLEHGLGSMVPCLIPRRMKAERMKGKWIRAEELKVDGTRTLYRHEDCAKF